MKTAQIFKRCTAVLLIVLLCIITIIPAFATVDWFLCLYSGTGGTWVNGNEGDVNYPYESWRQELYDLYIASDETVYFFEVRNTELGGTRYAPDNTTWSFAYGANQSGWGDVDLVYRFYVPYDGYGWNFQIRTSLGNVAFDSSTSVLYQDAIYSYIGYYEFTINRNLLGFDNGWYIYSNDTPPSPLNGGGVRMYNVQFDYYYGESIVATRIEQYPANSEPFLIDIPPISNFVVSSAIGEGSYSGNGRFMLNYLTTDTIIRVNVSSLSDLLAEEYQQGYDRGKTEGRAEGIIQGYQDYKNTQMYRDEIEDAYQDGRRDAIESGESGAYPPIRNPLHFVMTPVVSFLQIEVFPGLEIGTLFLASIAVSLIVIFLKLFAGG